MDLFKTDPMLMYIGENMPIDTDNLVFWLNDLYKRTNDIKECEYIRVVNVKDYIIRDIVTFARVRE